MTSSRIPEDRDAVQPRVSAPLTVTVDGAPIGGFTGQTIAGVLLGAGRLAWRTTSVGGRPRGVFCGIGVCFDCIVTVGSARDVRACLRRVREGDEIRTQQDAPVADDAAGSPESGAGS